MEKLAQFVKINSPDRRFPALCSCVDNLYGNGKTIGIHASDEKEAEEIDRRLWTYRQNSFIPHVRLGTVAGSLIEPVVIAAEGQQMPESDVLVVASRHYYDDWAADFEHVVDFAETYDKDLVERARTRFAKYREAGFRMRFDSEDVAEQRQGR